ncbi:MAG: PEP/pyruvate-binding domain-containing protein [Bacteroidales bacterium]
MEQTGHREIFIRPSGQEFELMLINRVRQIIREGFDPEITLHKIAQSVPETFPDPEEVSARIILGRKEYLSGHFRPSDLVLSYRFRSRSKAGILEIHLHNPPDETAVSPARLAGVGKLLSAYLEGKTIPEKQQDFSEDTGIESNTELSGEVCRISNRQLLHRFLNKNNHNRDIYHDLMPFKVAEILIISNLYDAYTIEKEGRFSEHMMGEYAKLNLTSLPRITGVTSLDEAREQMRSRHFDMMVIMVGTDTDFPLTVSEAIKKEFPYIPVYLLLNNNSTVRFFETHSGPSRYDRIFVWNGDSRIFFTMIKQLEDRVNLANDTRIAMVRYILVVEDSPIYYSRYLPLLYKIVLEQTRRIIEDVSTDELYKVLKLRVRPKILLATSYEEAIDIFTRFNENIFCLITDIKFPRLGHLDKQAGFDLVRHIRAEIPELPVIMQSSDNSCAEKAGELKTLFIPKESETLEQEIRDFIRERLGFGNFIYRDKNGKKLVEVRTMKDFEKHLRTVPAESILYHARKDHFSLWMMARGEIQAAKILHPKKATEFSDGEAIRKYLIDVIQRFRNEQPQGRIVQFQPNIIPDEYNIITLSEGQLGGKGRGLAFLNALIYNIDLSVQLKGIRLRTPRTAIIGTDEFETFLDSNNLHFVKKDELPYEELKWRFMHARLSPEIQNRLKILLEHFTRPIAVRSSSLFEDSLLQPFAGIFETYLLPNNHPDPNVRLQQLMDAIKLVYASVYSEVARNYFKAVNYHIEEEKMAVIIQEVVGNRYGSYYYPHISGVAQSYNYYPYSHMKPEEGFAVAAFGLGKYVVDGGKAYRFSPKYPTLQILSPKDQVVNSQTEFYAVDLRTRDINLLAGDTAGLVLAGIDEAERQGTLKHCASVYDPDNNVITAGLDKNGPRVVNFANILKYNYIPMAKTIEVILDIVRDAFGSPVELEFAIDLTRDKDRQTSFYLLQVKPMIGATGDYSFNPDEIDRENLLLFADQAMGNGIIEDVSDIVYAVPEKFDKSRTTEMAREVVQLNQQLGEEGRKYVLIGPGRWGTRDRWIGIPVNWTQISSARIIVETDLENYPLDPSSGSHFFHNVVSSGTGYFSVHSGKGKGVINWSLLAQQTAFRETKWFRHIRFDQPLTIKMDGRQRIAAITINPNRKG